MRLSLNVFPLALFLVAQSAHAGLPFTERDVAVALDEVMRSAPASTEKQRLGVVIRPPAENLQQDAVTVREHIINAGNVHPRVAQVVTLDDPTLARDTPDMTLAQDAGNNGMHLLLVARLSEGPEVTFTLFDPRGVELGASRARPSPPAAAPPPMQAQGPAPAGPPPEPVESSGSGIGKVNSAILSGFTLAALVPLTLAFVFGIPGTVLLAGSNRFAELGAADPVAREELASNIGACGLGLCGLSCCMLCLTPVCPSTGAILFGGRRATSGPSSPPPPYQATGPGGVIIIEESPPPSSSNYRYRNNPAPSAPPPERREDNNSSHRGRDTRDWGHGSSHEGGGGSGGGGHGGGHVGTPAPAPAPAPKPRKKKDDDEDVKKDDKAKARPFVRPR